MAQSWVVFRDKSPVTHEWNVADVDHRCATTASLQCLTEETNRRRKKKLLKREEEERKIKRTRHYTALLQLLHHSERLWFHTVLFHLTPCTTGNFMSRERQFYTSQTAVYVTSFYLAFILCCSFCAENIHKKPGRLVWLGNSTEDSERKKKERGLFLTKAISQRSPHTRWRNLWLWLKVKRHTMMKISSFDFPITPVWQKYLCRCLKGGFYIEKRTSYSIFSDHQPSIQPSTSVNRFNFFFLNAMTSSI